MGQRIQGKNFNPIQPYFFGRGDFFWRENLKFSFKIHKNSVKFLITRDDVRSKMAYAEWSLRMFAGSRTYAISFFKIGSYWHDV
ncbi:hypothetical protein [Helicobacter pylori]|uniref:hypothetical protein n=1 Tax=Helicobacter pylori TaxID=210 RepID=UPI001E2E6A39|nr:hypothetical protein [Helicobacter pylori]